MRMIADSLALERFEQRMIPHLYAFSPHHARIAGDDGLRRIVRLGIARARAYGIENPGLLRLYVDVMLMYGSFFDTDPSHAWASNVLRDATISDPAARMDAFHHEMIAYYHAVSGPDRAFDRQALWGYEGMMAQAPSPDDTRRDAELVEAFFSVHVRRATYVGHDRLGALVRHARAAARRMEVDTTTGITLVAFLTFTKGHGFAEDPALPWVGLALQDASAPSPTDRASRLEQAFYDYRDRAFAPLD